MTPIIDAHHHWRTSCATRGSRKTSLILGGTWPIVVDTGYRSNQIMETLVTRGMQSHETMIENQLKKHGLKLGDVRRAT
jgi:hypothetical protein